MPEMLEYCIKPRTSLKFVTATKIESTQKSFNFSKFHTYIFNIYLLGETIETCTCLECSSCAVADTKNMLSMTN